MTPHLEKLELCACNEFELHMPNKCPKLKALTLNGCKVSNLNLELTPHLEILRIQDGYSLQKIHAPVGCLKKVVEFKLRNCSNFELFRFEKWHKSAYIDSVATYTSFAVIVSKCPLHPNNNLPDFGVQCVSEEPGSSLSGYFEQIISADPCACKTFEYLLATICGLQHLRELTLIGSIPGDPWQLESLKKLTLRDLKSEINHLPDSICMLRHLKSLKLDGCKGIEQLPENICRLECLEELEITLCTSLRDIPNNIFKLKCLKRLCLFGCNQVEKLPVELGCLECLEELSLRVCESLREIPNSICNMKCLKHFYLACNQVEKLPEELDCLKRLEVLWITNCASLRDIPNNICKLKCLKVLRIGECNQVEKLPVELGCLEYLEELQLWECESLREIPNSICNMKCLKVLNLKRCNQVEKLPEEFGCLECLEELDIEGTGISRLPQSIYQLKGLRIHGSLRQLESCGFSFTSFTEETLYLCSTASVLINELRDA